VPVLIPLRFDSRAPLHHSLRYAEWYVILGVSVSIGPHYPSVMFSLKASTKAGQKDPGVEGIEHLYAFRAFGMDNPCL
jgi:hypothetical protein